VHTHVSCALLFQFSNKDILISNALSAFSVPCHTLPG